METLFAINQNLYNIFALFTREPYVHYFAKEVAFYSDHKGLLGVILFDKIDEDFSAILMSRDTAKQYRAESIKVDFKSLENAFAWLEEEALSDRIFHHEEANFFDLFKLKIAPEKRHPNFDTLNNHLALQAAKDVIKEISYHYKDIDGNFIDQFQSVNGFDARLWELYLFCFCREEYFSFNRNSFAPDFMIEKDGTEIALEAVTINRIEKTREALLDAETAPFSPEEIEEKLKNEVPLKYANALISKLQKKYWELKHVEGKALVIAIGDFHANMSMTWSFPALLEYLFAYKVSHSKDEKGNLKIAYTPIDTFMKPSGATVQAGFFTLPDSEHISAVLFTAAGTLSKFNRMGKQAGLGSPKSTLIRMGVHHDFDPNAVVPIPFKYMVDETCEETWAEGVHIFHNPNASKKIDPELFQSVAHHFLVDGKILSMFPELFPYASLTTNLITKG